MTKTIVVWVCPKDGNYYGSSSGEQLDHQWNQDAKGKRTKVRSTCPMCGGQRSRITFDLNLDEVEAPLLSG